MNSRERAFELIKQVQAHLEDYDGDWDNAEKLAEAMQILRELPDEAQEIDPE